MSVEVVTAASAGLPYGPLYAPDMGRTQFMGVEAARKVLGQRVDLAKADGERTVLTRHGQPAAIIVDMDWFRRAAEALGEPTDL